MFNLVNTQAVQDYQRGPSKDPLARVTKVAGRDEAIGVQSGCVTQFRFGYEFSD